MNCLDIASITNTRVVVDGGPDFCALFVVELDTVDVAFIPQPHHLALLPFATGHLATHLTAHTEAQRLGVIDHTRHEAIGQQLAVQVLADEAEAILALPLRFRPLFVGKGTAEQHMDALEHKALVIAFDGHDALVAKQFLALGLQQLADPILKHADVHVAHKFKPDRAHRLVVLVLLIGIQKIGLGDKNLVQVKRTNVHHHLDIDLRSRRGDDFRVRVDGTNASFDRFYLLRGHQVNLVQQNAIRKGDLLHRFVLNAIGFHLVQVLRDVFGVNHSDNSVQAAVLGHILVHKKRLGNRSRIGKASGLDNNRIELVFFWS